MSRETRVRGSVSRPEPGLRLAVRPESVVGFTRGHDTRTAGAVATDSPPPGTLTFHTDTSISGIRTLDRWHPAICGITPIH